MLLLLLTVSSVFTGSSADVSEETPCYGKSFSFPTDYAPPLFRGQMYFTPRKGGPRKLMMDGGESKDPRLQVSIMSLRLKDLSETDEGTFSVAFGDDRTFDIISLTIDDCAEQVTQYYGTKYYCGIPRTAAFLEFTPLHSRDPPQILWNRTDPATLKGGRRQVKSNTWEMYNLTQADSGFYNFRKRDNSLISRIKLKVEEYYRHYDPVVNGQLRLDFPVVFRQWTVTFNPSGERRGIKLMTAGRVDREYEWGFSDRIRLTSSAIIIEPVETIDTGIFQFTDPEGHLALSASVEVRSDYAPMFVYVAVAAGIVFALVVCCCCVRKCCCKKSSSKSGASVPQPAAAPAVYYHNTNQPAGPSYSAAPSAPVSSYQPKTPCAPAEPAASSLGPPGYSSVNVHVNSPQPETNVLGGQEAAPAPKSQLNYNLLSSDTEPKFELKGMTSLSAPPLSSDSTFNDVYTSDKLNFL